MAKVKKKRTNGTPGASRRRCSQCRQYKEKETQFHKDVSNWSGYQNHCKWCGKKLARLWYWRNVEENRRKRREANQRRRARRRAEKLAALQQTDTPSPSQPATAADMVWVD